MSVLRRNHVKLSGRGTQPMLFAHGFGCDQNMWRFVAPAFEDAYRVVLFDHVGSGNSDLRAWRRDKYARLQGYADDVLEICRELALEDVVFVGHSVSAMIGVLAAAAEPRRFARSRARLQRAYPWRPPLRSQVSSRPRAGGGPGLGP